MKETPSAPAPCAARILVAVVTTAALGLAGTETALAIEFNGYFQVGAAARLKGSPDPVIYNRQLANFKLEAEPYERTYLRFEADVWNDLPSYDDGSKVRSRLREGYLRYGFEKLDVKIGRQQIAWGQADGIIVADQVSPFDLENFIIPKFDEIRLGVDALQLTYYFDSGRELELVYIAQFQSPDFPEDDSPWRFVTDDQLDAIATNLGVPVPPSIRIGGTDSPPDGLDHGEGGIRFKSYDAVADWAVGYLYSWDDRPYLYIDPTAGLATPTHERYHLITAHAVAPVGPALLKVESALELDRRLNAFNPDTANDGFASKENVWRTLFGADFKPKVPFWEQPDAGIQFIVDKVFSPESGLASEEDAFLASLRLSAAYRNETIKPWILLIGGLRGENTWLQTRVDYEPVDNWRFTLEADLFFGHAYDGENGGIYGSFHANDFVGAAVRWSF
jgi:hypothetical protein